MSHRDSFSQLTLFFFLKQKCRVQHFLIKQSKKVVATKIIIIILGINHFSSQQKGNLIEHTKIQSILRKHLSLPKKNIS